MNDLCTDIGYHSLYKHGEQLCGDHIEVIEQDDNSLVMVLADGLGSGVKACILSTLTATIISTMMANSMKVEDCVATIAATLPVCDVRKVAYSTFTIIRVSPNRQQAEIAKLQDFVARNKARVATRNMAMSRQKKLDKMEVIELAKEKPKPEFHFLNARATGKLIFETKDLVIGYDEPLSKPLNFLMERGEKIAVIGANGIGKTTFLKSIQGLIPAISGTVEVGDYQFPGYFEQEMAPGNTTTCIEEIWKEFPSYTQYEVRSALAKCGLTTKNIESQVRVLSGGEQAKVRLCKLMNRETNVLLLDEPTNHLDVDAKDELKRALSEYKGAVLLICHEPEFYDGLVSKVWDLSKWSLKI